MEIIWIISFLCFLIFLSTTDDIMIRWIKNRDMRRAIQIFLSMFTILPYPPVSVIIIILCNVFLCSEPQSLITSRKYTRTLRATN